jgi:hypothetical protein
MKILYTLIACLFLTLGCASPKSKTEPPLPPIPERLEKNRKIELRKEDLELLKFYLSWYNGLADGKSERTIREGRVSGRSGKALKQLANRYNHLADKYTDEALKAKGLPVFLPYDIAP